MGPVDKKRGQSNLKRDGGHPNLTSMLIVAFCVVFRGTALARISHTDTV